MKIPLVWLKDYLDIDKTPKEIAESFTALGLMLEKPIENNVLELEHRFDRSDWLSVIGCARDLSAIEKKELKLPQRHTEKGKDGGGVEIKVECPKVVNRFNTRVFRGIKVAKSPKWLSERLELYGIPSINNVVDITNFVMVEYGQPMHAQDLSKFDAQEIVIRMAKKGEEITTLDGTNIILDPSVFILAQNDKPITIGGIVGGKETAITEHTTDIVIDAGNYDQSLVRKTARKYKIHNETVLRYDKFLHPDGTQLALERAVYLILELAGGEYYENFDYYPKKSALNVSKIRLDRIMKISGIEFSISAVKMTLESLGYRLLEESAEELTVEVPYFRTDFSVEDDIVSDILRVYNFENIPNAKINTAPPKDLTPEILKFEEKIRDSLIKLGLHEHITNPLVASDINDFKQIRLENSQNSEQNALRTNMYDTLFPIIKTYAKHKIFELGIFEIGKIYLKEGDKFEDLKEVRVVEVIYEKNSNLREKSKYIKSLLFGLFHELDINNINIKKHDDKNSIYQGSLLLGEIRFNSFSLFTENLLCALKNNIKVVDEFINTSEEDLSLILEIGKSAGDIINFVNNFDDRIIGLEILDEYEDSTIGLGKKAITFRLKFVNEKGITEIKESLIRGLEDKFGIKIRK